MRTLKIPRQQKNVLMIKIQKETYQLGGRSVGGVGWGLSAVTVTAEIRPEVTLCGTNFLLNLRIFLSI